MKACFDWLMDRRARHLTNRIRAWIPPGSHVADVGSGTGHNARAWRELLGATVDEFDAADLHWVGDGPMIFDGRKLPVSDQTYSVVTILFVMHYVHQPAELLQEIRRITSGRVVMIQSTYRGTWGRVCLNLRNYVWGPLAYQVARFAGIVRGQSCPLMTQRLFSRRELRQLFQEAGLTVCHWDTQDWWGLSISRDLYVLERNPRTSTCPSSSPRATKNSG